MSIWSDLKKGLEDGFTGRPCRVHGERYPGCPLDQIERARPSPPRDNGAWEDYAWPAPFPAPQVDPYAQAMIANLRAENEQCRQLIAEYQEVTATYAARPEVPAEWQQVVAEQHAAIKTLTDDLMHAQATRDRYQTNGKRIAAEKRELEALANDLTAVLQYPGMRTAMLAARHPDRGKTEAEKRARTVQFQKVGDVFDRIEKKGRAR